VLIDEKSPTGYVAVVPTEDAHVPRYVIYVDEYVARGALAFRASRGYTTFMRALILVALAAVALSACAALSSAPASSSSASPAAYCPDNPSCLTSPDCTMDKTRGCLTCRCSTGTGPNPGIVNSESIPPLP